MFTTYRVFFFVLIRLMDIAVLLVAWVVAFAVRWLADLANLSRYAMPELKEFLPLVLLSAVHTPIVFAQHELYELRRARGTWRELGEVARAVLLVWVGTSVLASLVLHALPSRILLLSLLGVWMLLAIAGRYGSQRFLPILTRWLGQEQSAAIIGSGRSAQKLYHTLRSYPWLGTSVRYFLADDYGGTHLCGLPVHPIGPDVTAILQDKPVDVVFLALPEHQVSLQRHLVGALADLNISVALVPDLLSVRLLDQDVIRLGDFWVFSLTHSRMAGWRGLVKRLLDIVLSGILLILLLPVFTLLAILVKYTSRGPIFYSQARSSVGGKEFPIYKFRTMRVDAEAATGAVWAQRNDPRVTRIGGLLRKTSLDELPQLWNVFIGKMSLVGPRPERPELIKRFQRTVPKYMLRSRVKAGMTGWAQINGYRGDTSLRKRLQYDLYYIVNWSLIMDLFVLAATIPFGFIARTPRTARRTALRRAKAPEDAVAVSAGTKD